MEMHTSAVTCFPPSPVSFPARAVEHVIPVEAKQPVVPSASPQSVCSWQGADERHPNWPRSSMPVKRPNPHRQRSCAKVHGHRSKGFRPREPERRLISAQPESSSIRCSPRSTGSPRAQSRSRRPRRSRREAPGHVLGCRVVLLGWGPGLGDRVRTPRLSEVTRVPFSPA